MMQCNRCWHGLARSVRANDGGDSAAGATTPGRWHGRPRHSSLEHPDRLALNTPGVRVKAQQPPSQVCEPANRGRTWKSCSLRIGVASCLILAAGSGIASPGDQEAAPASYLVRPMLHTITVIGEGRATAKPDVAMATIGVETIGKTLAEANDRNNAKMEGLVKTLKASGISDKDIQTANYSVVPERKYSRETGPGEITSFRISNQVRVKFRDLKKIGATLDQVVKDGANTVQSIAFEADDPTPIRARASAAAVGAAHVKAEEIAKAAGIKLGEVVQISEVIGGEPRPMAMMAAPMAAGAPARSVPVEQGELEFTAHLQVIYAIR